ncbi:MAG: aspartate dehydrogenase [Devosiaceae bacterium]|nr:aspartate dehydrogenase [Devosiaceae bacterium MH13]
MAERPRLAFIGWGAINARVGELLAAHNLPVDIVAIAKREGEIDASTLPPQAALIRAPDELAAHRPTLVVEAAGREALELWAQPALEAARRLICASTSAFTDDAFRNRMIAIAQQTGGQIQLAPGAIGGLDAVRAASFAGITSAHHTIRKPPLAWRGTPADGLLDLATLPHATEFFTGSAREAANSYPKNANATATSALAGVGLDETSVSLVADPTISRNLHEITISGAAGETAITMTNAPSATNPKTSDMTALSIVRLIEHTTAHLII